MPQLFTYQNKVFYLSGYTPRGSATIQIRVQSGRSDQEYWIGDQTGFSAYVFAVSFEFSHEVPKSIDMTLAGHTIINLFEFGDLLISIGFYYFHPDMINRPSFSAHSTASPLPFRDFFQRTTNYLFLKKGEVEYLMRVYFSGSNRPLIGALKSMTFSLAASEEIPLPLLKGHFVIQLPYQTAS